MLELLCDEALSVPTMCRCCKEHFHLLRAVIKKTSMQVRPNSWTQTIGGSSPPRIFGMCLLHSQKLLKHIP